MKVDIGIRCLICTLALLVCQACLADYPETWLEIPNINGIHTPIKDRNLWFDARMEGESYNNMVSGTATEFTIYTDIDEYAQYYNGPDPWNVWYIKDVRVKIDGQSLSLNLDELTDPLENSDYARRIRWASNEFVHDDDVVIELEVDAMFERWLFLPFPPVSILLESSPLQTIPLSHTVRIYNKGLALATTVDATGTVVPPTDPDYGTSAPGVAKVAADDARGKLFGAKHEVFPGIHHDKLELAQYLDAQDNPVVGNDPKLQDTTAFFAMTHGFSSLIIYDEETGPMHQTQNIHPVTKPPNPNDPGPFDRTVPPMNFAWFYACTLGNDGLDWRIKLNISSGSGALFAFRKVVFQVLDSSSSALNLDVPVGTELPNKLSDHSAELLTKLVAGLNAEESLEAANDNFPPRRPYVQLLDPQGVPFWRFKRENMVNFGGGFAQLVSVYIPEGINGVEVYETW